MAKVIAIKITMDNVEYVDVSEYFGVFHEFPPFISQSNPMKYTIILFTF